MDQEYKYLKEQLQLTEDIFERVDILNQLVWQLHNTEVEQALLYAQEAINLLTLRRDSSDQVRLQAEAYRNLAALYLQQYEYEQALKTISMAQNIAQNCPDFSLLSSIHHILSQIYQAFDQYNIDFDLIQKQPPRTVQTLTDLSYHAVFDVALDAILLIDESFQILQFNRGAELIFGYRADEVQCQPMTMLIPDKYAQAHQKHVQEFIKSNAGAARMLPNHIWGKRKDGEIFPAQAAVSKTIVAQGPIYTVILHDVSDYENALASIRQQNLELDAFAHTVAHDLKNPLAIVRGYIDIILDDLAHGNDADINDFVHNMGRSTQKAVNIIDELLLLATVRREEVIIEPFDMSSAVHGAIERLTTMIDDYQAEIDFPTAWQIPLGHGPWIEEVWVNFISNAIKYGGTPPKINVSVRQQDNGFIRYVIHDNGFGLADEDIDKVFIEFTRLENVRAQGHGLGLSIVSRIVQKLGGQVGVEKGLHTGCRFYFTLPSA